MKQPQLKPLLSRVGRAIHDFDLIGEGDRIAVGVSGGKDSVCLLYVLNELRKASPVKFDLCAIHVSMGWPVDITPLQRFVADLGIDLITEETQIGPIVFDIRQESNPCSLCAKMRRGALHNTAIRCGCNKVALAHHQDDVIETLLMSMFYMGLLQTFKPKTFLDRKQIILIRPLVYTPEELIQETVAASGFPTMHNPCPANGFTKRQEMKELIRNLSRTIPDIRDKTITALRNINEANLWPQKPPKPRGDSQIQR